MRLVHIAFASLLEDVYIRLTYATGFKIVPTTVMKSTAVSIHYNIVPCVSYTCRWKS